MPVQIQCPNPACGKAGRVGDEHVGKAVRCPHCKTRFAVPGADELAAATKEQGPETQEYVPDVMTTDFEPGNEEHETSVKRTAKKARAETIAAEVPSAIGRFQVLGVLGAGAFGTVYRAFDPQLDREVALKVPQAAALDSSLGVERFLREARTAAKLRHPNIVPIYEAGQAGDKLFIASAIIDGQSLDQMIDAGPLDFRRAAQIVRALAEALACAHESGIVHRDVKPANVMIDSKGLPLLMDFGLAHHRQQAAAKLTQQGTILGTPAYMAPEQAKGQTDDPLPASDQYSLGVVLYELLCGKRPFRGPFEVVLFNTIHTPPPLPRDLRPGIPAELEQICLRALSKRPPDRFPTCQIMADSLGRWLEGEKKGTEPPVRNVPSVFQKPEPKPSAPSRPTPAQKKAALEKPKSAAPVWIAIVLVLALAGAYFLWPKGSTRLPLDGTWIVQSMQVGGKEKPDAKGITWIIQGETLLTQGKSEKGTIKTDRTKSPPTIDVVEDLANAGLSAAGICELDGDVLKICFGTRDGKRPVEFSSTAKNRQALLVMKMQKP